MSRGGGVGGPVGLLQKIGMIYLEIRILKILNEKNLLVAIVK